MNIGIIGANGFIGKTLIMYLREFHSVISITRKNYNKKIDFEYNVLINADGNSRKYWANHNPLLDFEASVNSVYRTLFDFQFDKYIYISTIDVYKNNIYGFHKHLAEEIIHKHLQNYLILRCPLVIGRGMKKGVLKDILNEKSLYVTKNSRYQFITNTEIARVIHNLIKDTRIYSSVINMGSIDSLTVQDILEFLGKDVKIKRLARTEEYFESPSNIHNFKTAKDYIEEVL